jgi:hypothetical protein
MRVALSNVTDAMVVTAPSPAVRAGRSFVNGNGAAVRHSQVCHPLWGNE